MTFDVIVGQTVAGWAFLVAFATLLVVVPAASALLIARAKAESRRRERELLAVLEQRTADVERRQQRLDERERRLDQQRGEVETRLRQAEDAEAERRATLAQIAALSHDEAREQLLTEVEHDARLQAGVLARDIEKAARDEAESDARRILTTAIQRLASELSSETSATVVSLPSEDMKGRVIGREGRNIRAFEQITGVNLVVDDTPGAVVLSCFEPIRREVARVALESLLADGRIHPTRIEDAHRRAEEEVEALCRRAGEDACLEMGITDLHPELVLTMGKLRYRTSYGQNVLDHLRESGHAAGLLADEIGLDRIVCVRAAFLHDLGKALTHETSGSHALVGAELARRYGESEDVVHAIEAHHNEVEPRTAEAVLTQAADAISSARPGARRECSGAYVARLQRLEEIALAKVGVERVYAMQAGRDVRVMVKPEQVDDLAAQLLARDLAKQFEEELTYPGQIKVTVIRESRATEVAR